MSIREVVQRTIDEVQFRFDAFPTLHYQPLPWLGLKAAKRGHGTQTRWEAIEQTLDSAVLNSALDIGCNAGYFCFSLALKGIPTLGVDMDDRQLRIARYAARKIKLSRVGFCHMIINRETVQLLPQTDLVLLLSVWHHWVHQFGLRVASEMLSDVWEKTNQVMFFETGEGEMPSEFGLPVLTASPREWLEHYLRAMCFDSEVVWLGSFKAFGPRGDESKKVVYRNLFKVRRVDDELSRIAGTMAETPFGQVVAAAGSVGGSFE